jgi:hypothetical protein
MKLTPKQLELTADRTREELLIQALPPHIDPESATFKADLAKVNQIEREDAARAVLGSGFAFQQEEIPEEEFNWNTDDSIILKEQRATAAYRNKLGELIIRQRAGWNDDGDTFVYISPENEVTFMEGLAKRARE